MSSLGTSSLPRVFCMGNGMTRFCTPQPLKEGEPPSAQYSVLDEAAAAARAALQEAALEFASVDAAVCGFVYADSTAGQAAVYRLGLSGIPIYNVNNNCATGSTALSLARNLVMSGQHHCVLAVGFEHPDPNGIQEMYPGHGVFSRHLDVLEKTGLRLLPAMGFNIVAAYSMAASRHMTAYGTTPKQFATVAHKNRIHGQNNPNALLQSLPAPSIDEVLAAPSLGKKSPITFAMAAPLACGAAAAVLVSERFLRAHLDKAGEAVEIIGQALRTDSPATFDVSCPASCIANICGFDISRRAADAAYLQANITPEDVDVTEVHDAFASNELAMYEALRLCPDGGGGRVVDSGEWRDNGKGAKLFHYPRNDKQSKSWVANPSGGIESKGHPLGCTGLAQCAELCWQLRGVAGKRQVPDAGVALQHNYGWASAAVVTVYKRAELGVASIQGIALEDQRARL